jgi:hypothetical protein
MQAAAQKAVGMFIKLKHIQAFPSLPVWCAERQNAPICPA